MRECMVTKSITPRTSQQPLQPVFGAPLRSRVAGGFSGFAGGIRQAFSFGAPEQPAPTLFGAQAPSSSSGGTEALASVGAPQKFGAACDEAADYEEDRGDVPMSKAPRLEEASPGSPGASTQAHSEPPVTQLSRLRETRGFWKPSAELAALLLSRKAGKEAGAGDFFAAAGHSREVWATALVLAWLHKHAPAERGLWSRMWDKAMAWLQVCCRPEALDLLLQSCPKSASVSVLDTVAANIQLLTVSLGV